MAGARAIVPMNIKLILLLIGLIVGGLVGYGSRPPAAEIRLGPVSIQVTGPGANGELTTGQMQHIALIALLGAVLGLGLGLAAARRGFKF